MDAEKIETNTPKAYIHFERATAVAFFHNSREAFLPQTSYEELRGKNICDRTAAEARALYKKLDEQADAAFLAKAGRRTNMKENNKIWEYVCLLKEENTWEDVERLMRRVEQETGYTTLQASLHEDEGHVDENGIFRKNRHIQVDVFTRSLEDGRSLSLENYGRKDLMKKLQKIVSEELGLEEGEPKELTKRKHIPHRKYRAMKEAEKQAEYEQKLEKTNAEWEQKLAQNNKEWEAKLAANNAEWQAKMAEKQKEWEAKLAEREAKREEWEKKIPEIIAARERRSKFICEKLDWEDARTGKKLAYEMEMLGIGFAGISNPQGNIIIEAQKDAIRNVFYMLGATAQLAVFLMKKTLQNDEKLAADAKIFNVEATLLRAVDYVANSDPSNAEELKKRIQRTFRTIPEDKREELFLYALENAPTPELKNDIRALIEGRFDDIARTEAAQKRIENRDLRQALKEYSEEIRKIKEDLRAMDEENRILVAAERAILKEKGAGRAEYADQEAQNRERLNELSELKQQAKDVKKTIDEQREEKDAKTIRELNDKIAELTAQIAEITAENIAKQKELEQELEAEKAARKTAEIITPQMLDSALKQIDELEQEKTARKTAEIITPKQLDVALEQINELEQKLKQREEQKPEDAFSIIDDIEGKLKQPEPIREEPKIEPLKRSDGSEQSEAKPKPEEPKPEPEPIAKKDDNLNIYGYARPQVEPRRRFDDYEPRRPREPDRPKYVEPEPEPEPIFRDPWTKIENDLERWKKADSEVDKKMLSLQILQNIEKYEKSGVPPHRQLTLDAYVQTLRPNLAADAEEIRKIRERELERKRQAERETSQKFEDVKAKNVKQEADARQMRLKKKKEDYEMGMI
jgi:mobilization protein